MKIKVGVCRGSLPHPALKISDMKRKYIIVSVTKGDTFDYLDEVQAFSDWPISPSRLR